MDTCALIRSESVGVIVRLHVSTDLCDEYLCPLLYMDMRIKVTVIPVPPLLSRITRLEPVPMIWEV